MAIIRWILLPMVALSTASCATRDNIGQGHALPPMEVAEVKEEVRAFAMTVAREVTKSGPIAWSQFFEDSPAFFMAVNGQVAFGSGQDAQQSLPKIAVMYKRIQLDWGDEMRIDPLTRSLAIIAVPWREALTDSSGHTANQSGYFTALAENHEGHWQFRDVHWSSPVQ